MTMQMWAFVLDHLWQSTWFVLIIGVLVALMRKNAARVRYWLWFAATLKFLIPFSLLIMAGGAIGFGEFDSSRLADIDRWLETSLQPASSIAAADTRPAQSALPLPAEASVDEAAAVALSVDSASPGNLLPLAIQVALVAWFAGTAAVLVVWLVRWLELRRLVAVATPIPNARDHGFPVPVLESDTTIEPGIVGIVRPVLLLPKGIMDRLSSRQIRAVLAHERLHLERRDNLTASIHMLVEAVFWFHPLIWWIGARLIEARERACDEAAVRLVESPEAYADGILGVCTYYVAPPSRWASSISGGDLRERIESILSRPDPEELTMRKKSLLASVSIAAILGPMLLGGCEQREGTDGGGVGASTSEWRNSPYVADLYEQALAEGEVVIVGFDRRGVNWMEEAIPLEFPGITVQVIANLEHLRAINSRLASPVPLPYDIAQTSLMEARALNDGGRLAAVDWSEFGVPEDRVVPGAWFAYTNSFVFTVAYDRARVPDRAVPDSAGGVQAPPPPSTWQELLQPEFKGRLSTNPFMMSRLVAGLGIAWGADEAEAYARELAGNQEMLVRFGDAALIMLDEDMNYPYYVGMANTGSELWVRAGLPVRYVVPEPVIMEQQGSAVLASAPHPAAARLIAGYLASPEGIAARQRYSYSTDLRADSSDPEAVELRAQADSIVYDTLADATERLTLFEAARSIFYSRPQ
jgi:beta-lactamase regulating signal transducer with metallopeptidase domain/ABC-type Fe3+ transport system substrate-binding protein